MRGVTATAGSNPALSANALYAVIRLKRQERSGLGIEAQRAAIAAFTQQHGHTIEAEYLEIETGKGHDALTRRPKLAAALAHARRLSARLVVAKLCRLGRDVHFISGLMAERVDFVVAELGDDAPSFTTHILAAVAQQECLMISQRTKEALKAAKARGVKLGTFGKALGRRSKAAAKGTASRLAPVIASLRAEGITAERAISAELNRRNVPSARGGAWHPTSVARLLRRL